MLSDICKKARDDTDTCTLNGVIDRDDLGRTSRQKIVSDPPTIIFENVVFLELNAQLCAESGQLSFRFRGEDRRRDRKTIEKPFLTQRLCQNPALDVI
jgi:hypothetical protein